MADSERASAGHKLGQLVGDWFEEHLALPLLQRVAWSDETADFIYEITYTDGTEFERTIETIDDVKKLHRQIERLSTHMRSLKR